jgi:hypothetical protein
VKHRSYRTAERTETQWGEYYWINRNVTASALLCDEQPHSMADALGERFWAIARGHPDAWRRALIRQYQRRVSGRGCLAACRGEYLSRYAPPVAVAGVAHHHGVQQAPGARRRRRRRW